MSSGIHKKVREGSHIQTVKGYCLNAKPVLTYAGGGGVKGTVSFEFSDKV